MGDQIWPGHLKLSFGGTLGTPAVETWSNTLRFHYGGIWAGVPIIGVDPAVPTRDQLVDLCNLMVGPIHDWMQNPSSKINSNARAKWCKLNWITEDGTQRDLNTVVTDFASVPGVDMYAPAPYFVTQVITLRTNATRGRGHAGRIYPPMVSPSPEGTTPYISAEHAGLIAQSAAAFIQQCADTLSMADVDNAQTAHAVVVSPGSHEKGTAPIAYDIISAVVDRVPDVMHSRTKSIPRLEGVTVRLGA